MEADDLGFYSADKCCLCSELLLSDIAHVHSKGLDSLIVCSEIHGNDRLCGYLQSLRDGVSDAVKVRVHASCRKEYTRNQKRGKDSITSLEVGSSPKKLRSSSLSFDWQVCCFLCGDEAIIDEKHPQRDTVHIVETLSLRKIILDTCEARASHPWSRSIDMRVRSCICLVAAEARYHRRCYKKFVHERANVRTFGEAVTVGRPVDEGMYSWFLALCHWLENDSEAELYTLDDLMQIMSTLAGGEDVYTKKTLRLKLKEHYGDHIFFAQVGGGQSDVVCFRAMADYIVHDRWYVEDRRQDLSSELKRIMITCARLIKEEIREHQYEKNQYPTADDINNVQRGLEFLTPCLRTLVENLFTDDVKRSSIGQMITQAVRPKSVLSPIMFGLGSEMDFVFGSQWLVDELYSLGMSVSYDEIRTYKQSIIQDENLCMVLPPRDQVFTQWGVDNADATICTLVGDGQFHGIGMCAMSAVNKASEFSTRVERKAKVKVTDLIENKGVPLFRYVGPASPALSKITFTPVIESMKPHIITPAPYYANLLWQSSRSLSNSPVTNWSGYMEHFFCDREAERWNVTILPVLDMNPNEDSSLYSTLLYIQNQAEKLGVPDIAVTFDQPLWLKATEIVEAKNMKNIVLKLGGFHLLMSALGSVFHVMEGSGLEDALLTIYGENVVKHIVSGKAYARAVRASVLLESALMTILVSKVCGETADELSGTGEIDYQLTEEETRKLKEMVNSIDITSSTGIAESDSLLRLDECLNLLKTTLAERSRTSKLWIQYLYHVECIKDFIRAERIPDWEGHLVAVGELLNLFAATRHLHYAKCARLYLQQMRKLPETHPWLYEKFAVHGLHAVRRSPKFWAGLSPDLVVEQVVMRSLKSRGGLTRGRGVTESVRQQWVLTMHQFASIHDAMTSLTGRHHETSEQHAELGKSRRNRDERDYIEIFKWLQAHDPFSEDSTYELRSLSTGLTASKDDNINCDRVEEVGQRIQSSLDGVAVSAAKLKKSDAVRTLQQLLPGVKVGNDTVQIDPAVLFLRCTALAERLNTEIAMFFAYEMTAVPTSLFKGYFMRKSDKSDLAHALQKLVKNHYNDVSHVTAECIHIIDGGWLLYQLKWTSNMKYQELAENYSSFVMRNYGPSCIVFDGYDTANIKDHEHLRRSGKKAPDITINGIEAVYPNRDAFLMNDTNKSYFIKYIASFMRTNGHKIVDSTGDADVEIVATAIRYAREQQPVSVVAEDTDIFILLLHHFSDQFAEIYLQKENRSSKTKSGELYRMSECSQSIDPSVREHIIFIHSWSGTDTTSFTYGHGKIQLLKKISGNEVIVNAAVLEDDDATATAVGNAGISIFCNLYGGEMGESLTALRYRKYNELIANNKTIQPERLPPTERAAYHHSLRVHLQVMRWIHLDNSKLNALEWGWKLDRGLLRPVMTDAAPAPDDILKFIKCNCKALNNLCGSYQCSCRKNGMKCVPACGICHGLSCSNRGDDVTAEDDDI